MTTVPAVPWGEAQHTAHVVLHSHSLLPRWPHVAPPWWRFRGLSPTASIFPASPPNQLFGLSKTGHPRRGVHTVNCPRVGHHDSVCVKQMPCHPPHTHWWWLQLEKYSTAAALSCPKSPSQPDAVSCWGQPQPGSHHTHSRVSFRAICGSKVWWGLMAVDSASLQGSSLEMGLPTWCSLGTLAIYETGEILRTCQLSSGTVAPRCSEHF